MGFHVNLGKGIEPLRPKYMPYQYMDPPAFALAQNAPSEASRASSQPSWAGRTATQQRRLQRPRGPPGSLRGPKDLFLFRYIHVHTYEYVHIYICTYIYVLDVYMHSIEYLVNGIWYI